MTNKILFVVGPPGAGKTTFIRALIELDSYLTAKPKWTVGEHVVAAGHYTGGTFDGADTVPYNGVEAALDFWTEKLRAKAKLTIFDGDRFSHDGVKDWATIAIEAECRVLYFDVSQERLAINRAARGSTQNAAWMKGRETKALRFAEKFTDRIDFDPYSSKHGTEAKLLKSLRSWAGL